MSTLALIVLVVAVLLPVAVATLIVGGRRAAGSRAHRELGGADERIEPYRSHAEASRRASPR